MAKIINTGNFRGAVEDNQGVVVVDFFATWCGPCKMLTPIFESLSNEMSDKVDFGKIDIDRSLEVAQAFNIVSVPTMIIFKNGNMVEKMVGFTPKEQLKSKIQAHLK